MKTTTIPDCCYWCGGIPVSHDHVPPSGFFPQGKNINLFTVPSCAAHNQMFSKLDERFRFYIQGVAEGDVALDAFKDKTVRGLQREQARRFTASLARDSTSVSVEGVKRLMFSVDAKMQERYFEKLMRGVYYLAFKEPAQGRIVTASPKFHSTDLNYAELAVKLGPYLNDGSIMKEYECPNPDIFRFRYGRVGNPPMQAAAIVVLLYGSVEILGLFTPLSE